MLLWVTLDCTTYNYATKLLNKHCVYLSGSTIFTCPKNKCDSTDSIIFLLPYEINITINLTSRLQRHPTRPDLSRVGPDLPVLPTSGGISPWTLTGKCETEGLIPPTSDTNDTYRQGGTQNNWQLVSRYGHFYHFRGIILCSVNDLQFHSILKWTKGNSSESHVFTYVDLFKLMDLLLSFSFHKNYFHCYGSIVIFDDFWFKNIFYKNQLVYQGL